MFKAMITFELRDKNWVWFIHAHVFQAMKIFLIMDNGNEYETAVMCNQATSGCQACLFSVILPVLLASLIRHQVKKKLCHRMELRDSPFPFSERWQWWMGQWWGSKPSSLPLRPNLVESRISPRWQNLAFREHFTKSPHPVPGQLQERVSERGRWSPVPALSHQVFFED